jgi:hypothetical protein
MVSKKQLVYNGVIKILEKAPKGLRFSEIKRQLKELFGDKIKETTLTNYLVQLRRDIEEGKVSEIVIPDKGVYIHRQFYGGLEKRKPAKVREEEFYPSFANFLVNDLMECTTAIPLGGNLFQDKWGTPDVIGVYKFSEIDPIKPPPEIVTAEIKIDENQLITAFGQACAYKLFSHKVYLVVPNSSKDLARVESLCLRFGIGLIVFDATNPENPNYEIRTRALKSEPDYYYLNEYLRKLKKEQLAELFG